MLNSFYIIINPVSGRGKGLRAQEVITNRLNEAGKEVSVICTDRPQQELSLARKAVQNGFRNIICVGGDGTLNEIVNGVFSQTDVNPTEIKLGVIPAGTGNDWCRHHNIKPDVEYALQTILNGKTILHDIGIAAFENTQKHFINISGAGFEGYVAVQSNKSRKVFRGKFFYMIQILKYFFQYSSTAMQLKFDGKIVDEKIFSAAVAICKYNGAGLMQAPQAVANDGMFDITIIKDAPKMQLLACLPRMQDGSFIKNSNVQTFKTNRVSLSSTVNCFVDTDGETGQSLPVTFSIMPNAMQMFVP